MSDLVTYRGPFMGTDVSVPETDINPTSTPYSDNFFNFLNELRTSPACTFGSDNGTLELTRCFGSFYNINSTLVDYIITPSFLVGVGNMSSINGNQILAPIIYNGVMYFPSGNSLYSYDGITFNNPASAYSGGYFINKLASHLLLLNTVEGANNFPQRVRWSASGLPTVLDPTVNTNAGYNDLDTAEAITGFFVSGYNGVITTSHSLIEMVPTGNGISPFAFYNIEAASEGVGNYYVNSLDSFGIFTIFAAEDDIYLMSQISGLKNIGGNARAAIYADLLNSLGLTIFDAFSFNLANGPIGSIVNSYSSVVQAVNTGSVTRNLSTDGLYYILSIPIAGGLIWWIYDLKRDSWYRWVTGNITGQSTRISSGLIPKFWIYLGTPYVPRPKPVPYV